MAYTFSYAIRLQSTRDYAFSHMDVMTHVVLWRACKKLSMKLPLQSWE